MPSRMVIVAAPPGGGKSNSIPVSRFGIAYFNAGDRAAVLDGGSYVDIPLEVRSQVNREFEEFIRDHIEERVSFALETTLRSSITFEQASAARRAGFETEMHYVAIGSLTCT